MIETIKRRRVFITNNESRIIHQERNIEYSLITPLPNDWKEMSIDEQGTWINNNALFVKDSFEGPYYDEIDKEETIDIRWDEDHNG